MYRSHFEKWPKSLRDTGCRVALFAIYPAEKPIIKFLSLCVFLNRGKSKVSACKIHVTDIFIQTVLVNYSCSKQGGVHVYMVNIHISNLPQSTALTGGEGAPPLHVSGFGT